MPIWLNIVWIIHTIFIIRSLNKSIRPRAEREKSDIETVEEISSVPDEARDFSLKIGIPLAVTTFAFEFCYYVVSAVLIDEIWFTMLSSILILARCIMFPSAFRNIMEAIRENDMSKLNFERERKKTLILSPFMLGHVIAFGYFSFFML